jgi:quercetin dioxygenase-like cupin family protein
VFYQADAHGYRQALPGITIKTLVHGEKTLLCEFRMDKGSCLPVHSHPHEQTGYLVSGRVRLTVGGETSEAGPGDSWCIPGSVTHGAQMLQDSTAIEVFSPVREEYLPAAAGSADDCAREP